jgi:hypothetical protein
MYCCTSTKLGSLGFFARAAGPAAAACCCRWLDDRDVCSCQPPVAFDRLVGTVPSSSSDGMGTCTTNLIGGTAEGRTLALLQHTLLLPAKHMRISVGALHIDARLRPCASSVYRTKRSKHLLAQTKAETSLPLSLSLSLYLPLCVSLSLTRIHIRRGRRQPGMHISCASPQTNKQMHIQSIHTDDTPRICGHTCTSSPKSCCTMLTGATCAMAIGPAPPFATDAPGAGIRTFWGSCGSIAPGCGIPHSARWRELKISLSTCSTARNFND